MHPCPTGRTWPTGDAPRGQQVWFSATAEGDVSVNAWWIGVFRIQNIRTAPEYIEKD